MKGLIMAGYQGVGKSALGGKNGCIDLESGCSYINGIKPDNWYVPYCQTAIHLAKQGYTVFTSSHKTVIDCLMSMDLPESIGNIVVFCPKTEMKEAWLKRLSDRYEHTHRRKDKRALKNAEEFYEKSIAGLEGCGLTVYQPQTVDYDLMDYVEAARAEWCEDDDEGEEVEE